MFSRIITSIQRSFTTVQRPRIIEDSSEELVRKTTSPIATSLTAVFGLSSNKTDDFIQKDLISSSLS